MIIEPKLMTDAELADFALTVERAFEDQSLAGLEMNFDAMATAGPVVLGHIAALTAERDAALGHLPAIRAALLPDADSAATTPAHTVDLARLVRADRDAHAARCVELQVALTEMEEHRDTYRSALQRHEERVVEQVSAFVELTDVNRWRLATLIRDGAWRK